ncbi:MAG: ATP-binding protein [Polyangiaceae bacterium]|nr:ATP-binding protein [Polyangiaceae bacterium]
MAEGRLLRKLITAGARSQSPEFREAAEQVIREERAKKHHLLANDLERILYGEPSITARPAVPRVVYDIPNDRERGLALFEIRQPVRDFSDIVLSEPNRHVLDDLLLEQGRTDVLGSHGLKPISRLLLYGPPGCGKTTVAEVLASELGLELAVVRVDAMISSFLGETAANMRKVFDFIDAGRFVVLFDEFDAVGKEREDPSEHGELKRVVNSFLQMVDAYRGKSVIVAATNHETLLDRALWRRFDEVLYLDRPTREQARKLLETKLRGVRSDFPLDEPGLLDRFDGMSHADIERVLIRAIKAMVLRNRDFLTLDDVTHALVQEAQRVVGTKRG